MLITMKKKLNFYFNFDQKTSYLWICFQKMNTPTQTLTYPNSTKELIFNAYQYKSIKISNIENFTNFRNKVRGKSEKTLKFGLGINQIGTRFFYYLFCQKTQKYESLVMISKSYRYFHFMNFRIFLISKI